MERLHIRRRWWKEGTLLALGARVACSNLSIWARSQLACQWRGLGGSRKVKWSLTGLSAY